MEIKIEQTLVSSLIMKPEFIQEVCELVNEKDFKVDLYRHAFKTISEMKKKNLQVELQSLYLEMGRENGISKIVEGMDDFLFDPPHYAKLLRQRNLENEIKRAAGAREFENTKERIRELESLGKPATLYNIQKMIEERPSFKDVFETGFQDIDFYVKFQPTDLMVIAGRPSVGKSCLGTAMLANMAEYFPVALISLEMSLNAIGKRLATSYNTEKLNRINQNFKASSPSTFSLQEVRKLLKECVDRQGVKVVMIDYLQLMEPVKRQESRRLEVTAIIRALKEMAKEFLIGMIVVSSLSRGQDHSENSRPHMGMLRESGDIEYAADIILMLHPTKNQNKTEVIIDKNRNGKAKKIINLVWLEEKITFGNWEWKEDRND